MASIVTTQDSIIDLKVESFFDSYENKAERIKAGEASNVSYEQIKDFIKQRARFYADERRHVADPERNSEILNADFAYNAALDNNDIVGAMLIADRKISSEEEYGNFISHDSTEQILRDWAHEKLGEKENGKRKTLLFKKIINDN